MNVDGLVIFAPFLPLLLTIFTAMVTMYRAWPRGDFLKGSHVPDWLMIGLLGIVAVAWAMIWLAPDSQPTSDGVSCKDLRGWDEAVYLLVFGAAVVGGLAWGTASLQRDSGRGCGGVWGSIRLRAPDEAQGLAVRRLRVRSERATTSTKPFSLCDSSEVPSVRWSRGRGNRPAVRAAQVGCGA